MTAACAISNAARSSFGGGWASDHHEQLLSRRLRCTSSSSSSIFRYRASSSSALLSVKRRSYAAVCTMASKIVSKGTADQGNWNRSLEILKEFEKVCSTPVHYLKELLDEMILEMEAGLTRDGGGKMRMLITFVDTLPDGDETGTYYALDLGGTNFRVLRVELGGREGGILRQESKEVAIPHELMHGTNKDLFDYIAKELAVFAAADDKFCGKKNLELGFTFSFPIHQTSIASGNLIGWTKGFSVADTVGKNVVEELEAAIGRQGLDMRVSALVNDTVGTLARGHYVDDSVMISVILGTGTNACYVERADAIPKLSKTSGFMVINTEWGSSWSSKLPRADVDEALDAESINPGDQFFEKLVSGMYLGEILRRVLLKLAQEANFFGSEVPEKLLLPFSFPTPRMCEMHHDESAELEEVGRVLSDVLEIEETTIEMRKMVVEICNTIAKRAARLAGAGIVGLLKKIGRDGSENSTKTVVAIDGGLYEHYPKIREYLSQVVVDLLGQQHSKLVSIELSKDGSGVGAALIAACCHHR